MKISKLFHWLYAILMFLPILVFIPNAFYYGFNETSIAQEKTEQVPIYYESNDINTIDDLIPNNIYTINFNGELISNDIDILTYKQYLVEYTGGLSQGTRFQELPYFRIVNNGHLLFPTTLIPNSSLVNRYDCTKAVIDFVFKSVTPSIPSNILDIIGKCDRQYIKEYQPLTTNMSITDSMSYAWESTWQNELFSWSYDSFLTQPFLYITNLFNVPATNTLLYCLSYWLNISIIWLCFDVVMYVPLLVHRWLDKGIIE